MFYNLRVRNVILLGGPAPTTVWALSCNTYTVSGDNSSIVPLSVSLTKLVIFVPLCRKEYCVITPLGVWGALHCKIIDIEVTEITANEWGSLGSTMKLTSSVDK